MHLRELCDQDCPPKGGSAPNLKKIIMEYFTEIKNLVIIHMEVFTLNRNKMQIYLHIDLVQKLLLHLIKELCESYVLFWFSYIAGDKLKLPPTSSFYVIQNIRPKP